jgi:hypothetical protein
MGTRKLTNFAFDLKTSNLLEGLVNRFALSKTAVVQKAIEELARQQLDQKTNILNYAGTMSSSDADVILVRIQKDRQNKEDEVVL